MPLNLQKNLPAVELLKKEHIFVMDSLRASEQDIRPLRVVVLNLMPLKITTETDLVRLLSNTPLQVELDFMKIKGHTPKNTPIEHMKATSGSELILADEPTGNLDSENSRNIVGILQGLAHEGNRCVIIVTHDPAVAEVADVLLKMKDGKLIH